MGNSWLARNIIAGFYWEIPTGEDTSEACRLNACLLCSPSVMAGWEGITHWVQEVVEYMGQQLCWQEGLRGTGNNDRSSWDTEDRSFLRHSRGSCPLTVDSNSTWAREAMSQKQRYVLVENTPNSHFFHTFIGQ